MSICHSKLGFWQFEYIEKYKNVLLFEDSDYQEVTSHCEKATQINPQNLESWHIYATTSDETSIYYSKKFSDLESQRNRFGHLGSDK